MTGQHTKDLLPLKERNDGPRFVAMPGDCRRPVCSRFFMHSCGPRRRISWLPQSIVHDKLAHGCPAHTRLMSRPNSLVRILQQQREQHTHVKNAIVGALFVSTQQVIACHQQRVMAQDPASTLSDFFQRLPPAALAAHKK